MKVKIINFEEKFVKEKVVSNHKAVINNKFTDDGIFSEKIFGNLENETEYSCKCGETKGKFYEGILCEYCHTPVEEIHNSFNRIGWIDFGKYYFINPLFYNFIERIIGDLNSIINYQLNIDSEGLETKKDNDNKYHNIGLIKFKKHFEKILNYYYKKNSKKKKNLDEYYNLIMKNLDYIFINKLPIYSINLRPAMLKGNKLIFDKVNDFYNKILYNINLIKQNDLLEPKFYLPLLYVSQININKIFNYIINNISGKSGILRNNLLGCRINFSARAVIVPASSDRQIDEIEIPYIAFLELYKFQILRFLVIEKNIDYNMANNIWSESLTYFNNDLYDKIIQPMLNKGNLKVLLNRNPTISFGSILSLRLTSIKKDIEDYTMSISNNLLPILGGDYDGDTLNIIAIMDEKFKKFFEPLNPKNMLLNVNDGFFNSAFSLDNEQILGLKGFLEF